MQNYCSSFVTKLFDVSIRMIVYPFLLVLIYNVIHFILYSFKSEFVWYVIYCRFVQKCSRHCGCKDAFCVGNESCYLIWNCCWCRVSVLWFLLTQFGEGGGVQQNRIEYPVRSTCIYTTSFKLTIFIRGSWGECESSDQFFTCAEFPPPPEDRCCIVLFLCNHLSHEKKNDYIALFPPRKMIWLIHIF